MSSATNLALCVSPQPPTARHAPLNITRLQALFLGRVLSVMKPVTSAQEPATQSVKPATLIITQFMDVPRPA